MAGHSKISLFFPDRHLFAEKKTIVLGGDAGGTKVNLAFFEATDAGVRLLKSSTYHSGSFPSVNKILQQFMLENPDYIPKTICLGVAGPVFEGRVTVTNLPWHLDANEIAAATGVSQVILLNDLEATAYGLAGLEEKDFSVLHEGDPVEGGNISILAPGTGLGEAGYSGMVRPIIPSPRREDIAIFPAVMKPICSCTIICGKNIRWSAGKASLPVREFFPFSSTSVK